MSLSSKIGIAVVGTGFGQKIHIPGFQIHPQTEVVAVYHRNLAQAQAIANNHHIPYSSDSLTEILDNPHVQAVSISTPPFLHYEMAKSVLIAKKHLLLEKPTTLSAIEAKELYHLAKSQNVIGMMDFEFRCIPHWQMLAEMLAAGYIGQKRLIKIDWLVSSRSDPNRAWNWYSRQDQGGGALGAIASHSFDYISWLFGPIRRLSGHLTTAIPLRPDPTAGGKFRPVDADDTCMIMLELTDGTPCHLCVSSVTDQGRGHWVEVYGSKGTIILGNESQKDYIHGFRLWAAPHGESLTELDLPSHLEFPETYLDGRLAPFIRIVDRWVEGIERGQAITPTLREGVYSQLLIDLTHESHATGTWVDVPDLTRFLG